MMLALVGRDFIPLCAKGEKEWSPDNIFCGSTFIGRPSSSLDLFGEGLKKKNGMEVLLKVPWRARDNK